MNSSARAGRHPGELPSFIRLTSRDKALCKKSQEGLGQQFELNCISCRKVFPYPLGNPALAAEEKKALRRKLVDKALTALKTDVSG